MWWKVTFLVCESDASFPKADLEDDEMLEVPPLLHGDDCLLDVVNFPQAYTTPQKFEAQLLEIIHTTGAPNGAFPSIMSWARSTMSEGYDFQPSPLAYDRKINHLEKRVGMQSGRPTRVPVDLFRPDMEEDILDVVVFDFPTMLASLFNCPVLNKLENLVVNPTDRFAKYEAPNGKLVGEINSALWYDNAFSTLLTDPDKDFLCPFIFVMDKTVISEMAGLSVFVILFTSSIFNRKVSFCEPRVVIMSWTYLLFIHVGWCRHVTNPMAGVPLHIFPAKVNFILRNSTINSPRTLSNFDCSNCSKWDYLVLSLHNKLGQCGVCIFL